MAERGRLSFARAARLWAELGAVYFGVPAVVAMYVDPRRRFDALFGPLADVGFVRFRVLMPSLLVFTLAIFAWLVLDRTFDRRTLWNWRACRAELPRIVLLFVPLGASMVAFAWGLSAFTDAMEVTRRDGSVGSAFLSLPRHNPGLLVLIALAYPWYSAYPQEVTHRAFFFHRYGVLFRSRWAAIAVNAAAFSWLHAPFWQPIALLITVPAGVLFAWTFTRKRSTLASGIEHALYGWWAFFVGLGWFVYAGSLGA